MSNKNLCMFLVSRKGNKILIWSWNNPQDLVDPKAYFDANNEPKDITSDEVNS